MQFNTNAYLSHQHLCSNARFADWENAWFADTDKLTIARLLAGRALALEGEGAWEQALTDYEEAQSVAVAAGYAVCASTLQLFNCSDRIIVCDRILSCTCSARHYIAAAKCALEIAHPSRLHIVEN